MNSNKLNFIQNEAGLSTDSQDAQKVKKELKTWEKEHSKRKCTKFSDMSYWKMASTCTAL